MDFFSALVVYISIVLAAAVTRVLSGLAFLVQERERVEWDWLIPAWGLFFVFAGAAQWWNLLSGWRLLPAYSIGQFLFLILQPLIGYFFVALFFPRFAPTGRIDLHSHIVHVRSWGYPLAACYVLLYIIDDALLRTASRGVGPQELDWPQALTTGAAAGLILTGAFLRNFRYDRLLFVAVVLLMAFLYAFLA
jgi:hypothetical protein